MFENLEVLTNRRPTKDEGNSLIITPVKGQFRLTAEAQKTLGVQADDRVVIIKGDDNGKPVFGILKSAYQEVEGEVQKVAEFPKALDQQGQKLSLPGNTKKLSFGSTLSWEEMGGNVNGSNYYTLDADNSEQMGEAVVFPLVFDKFEEKSVRGSEEEEED